MITYIISRKFQIPHNRSIFPGILFNEALESNSVISIIGAGEDSVSCHLNEGKLG